MGFIKKAAFAAAMFGAALMLLCGSVFASNVEYGRIAYFDANGNPIKELVGGDTVVAKIKAKSTEPQKMMFVLLLYENDKLTACGINSKQTGSGITEYSAQLTVPADVKAPELNAIMWDSLSDMNPICASSTFGSNDTGLLGLSVNGVSIEEFDPEVTEYSVNLATDTTKVPLITAKTSDGAANIEVTDPVTFPGKSMVRVIAQNGEKGDKIYTINYRCDDMLVDNIEFPDELVRAQFGAYYSYFDTVTKDFVPYKDRDKVTVISDEIIGKPYIQGSLGQYTADEGILAVWNNPYATWFTFDLKRPAIIETYSEADLRNSRWPEIATKSTLDGNAPYYGWGWQCRVKYSMKMPAGKVEIPPLCTTSGMMLTFVFDGYSEPADINELDF